MEHRSSIEVTETIEEEAEEVITPTPEVEQTKPANQRSRQLFSRRAVILVSILAAVGIIIALASTRILSKASTPDPTGTEADTARDPGSVTIDPSQIQSIKLETAGSQTFRAEKIATGKIAFNEEVMTPVFSPYSGRVIRLLAKPGDVIK